MTHVYDNTITIFETYNPKLSNLSKHILINIYCKLIYVYRNHSTSHSEINILLIWWRHHSCHIIAFVLRLWVFCYCVTSAVSRVRGHFFFGFNRITTNIVLFVLFVWGFSCHFREFFTHVETSPLPVKAANFDPYSTRMAMEQWGFFSVSHLLWASVYKCHPRGPMTLTPIAERLAVKLSLPVCTT